MIDWAAFLMLSLPRKGLKNVYFIDLLCSKRFDEPLAEILKLILSSSKLGEQNYAST